MYFKNVHDKKPKPAWLLITDKLWVEWYITISLGKNKSVEATKKKSVKEKEFDCNFRLKKNKSETT